MPWNHCGLELNDSVDTCEVCGTTKAQWTVEFELTRNFRVRAKPALRLELLDARQEPIGGEPYEVTLPDGTQVEGELDEVGRAKVDAPAEGQLELRFPQREAGVVELLARRQEPLEEGAEDDPAVFRCRAIRGRWRFCAASFRVRVTRDEEPLAQTPFRLEVEGGETLEGESWEDGVVRADVPEGSSGATLVLRPPEGEVRLELSFDLAAASDVAGAQARLNNLGYSCGEEDGELGPFTAGALRRFQRAYGVERTGELDEATAARLEQIHGG